GLTFSRLSNARILPGDSVMRVIRMRVGGALLLASFGVVSIACTPSHGGHAERVDVPISIEMTVAGKPDTDCNGANGAHCTIHFRMTVTDQGTQGVNLLDCTAFGHDPSGSQLFETGFVTGIPAG